MDKEKKENEVVYLRLDDILPNQFQPREVFDETGLQELADSIKEHGVIQPVIVRPQGDKYELIAGERRCKASALAGLTKVPAIIREMDDKESAKVSLLENLQRRNLSAIEEARTYKKILELDNMTQDELAKTMGKSQPMIANKIRLLGLPEEVQDALIKNQISERHARSLLNIKNKEQQLMMLDRIRNERLTVRELDAEIKKIVQPIDPNEVINQDNSMQEEKSQEMNVGGEGMQQNMMNGDMNNNFNNNMNQEFNNSDNNSDNNNFNDNNINTGMPSNMSEPIPQNNQFGNTQNLYGNFSNMGLNDYQGSGMFNNIPNFNNPNMQNTSPIPTFQGGFSNPSTTNPNEGGNSFIESQPNMTNNIINDNRLNEIPGFNDTPSNSDTSNNNFNSLGSMFDGNSNSNNNQNMEPDYTSDNNSNTFISQIREDTIKPKENQFLPNFDTPSNFDNQNNFNDMSNMNNFDSQNDFGMNNFINQSQNQNSFNNFNNNNNMNNMNNMNNINNMNNDFSNPGLNNFGGPVNDFSFPQNNNMSSNVLSNNFNANQGGLFNQPLNIVSVPGSDMNNNSEPSKEENEEPKDNGHFDYENASQNNSDENTETENDMQSNDDEATDEESNDKESFDNPLDDAYEDILNAKPVAVNPEEEETEENNNETEDEEKVETKVDEESETKEQSEDNDTSEEASEDTSEEVEVIGGDSTSEDIETKENSESQDTSEDSDNEEDNQKKDDYIHLEPEKTIFDARGAVYELKKTTDAIKQNNINIDTEEIEFDDYYQITIKIKK